MNLAGKQYIKVPYEEKDEAKALGARWDAKQRSWFIPDDVDPEPFSRWMRLHSFFYIVVGHRTCWKCTDETTVVAFGIPYGEAYEIDKDDIAEGIYPAYDPEKYDSLALIPRLGATPRELRDYLERKYCYQLKRSKTTGKLQLNNCCDHCGALLGEFYDFDEPDGVFVPTSVKGVEELKFYRVHFDGRLYGFLNSYYSLDELFYSYAEKNCEELDLGIVENIYLL